MKIKSLLSSGSVAMALCLLPTAFSQVNHPQAGLSPAAADVARLVQSGNTDEVVLAYVQKIQTRFNLTAEDANNLRNAGVSSPVVTAMINHDKALPVGTAQAGNDQRLYQPAGAAATAAAAKPAPAPAPAVSAAPASQQHAAMTAPPQPTPTAAAPTASQAQPAAKPQTMTLTAATPAQQSSVERAPAAKPSAKPGDSRKAFMPEESNTHVYYTKSGRQAAEAHALPPMQQPGPGYDNPVSRSPRDIGRPGIK